MVTQTKPQTRIWMLALAGCFVAFAWMLLTLVLGWGTAGAHAADDDRGGLVGGVTDALTSTVNGVVDGVTGTATDTVTDTVSAVASTATAVLPPVVPAVDAVVPILQDATDAAGEIAAPVTDIGSSSVVTAVVDPLVTSVASVPVVGNVVTTLGVDHAASAMAETVDHALGTTIGAVDSTVRSVPDTLSGAVPSSGTLPGLPGLSGRDVLLPALTWTPSTVAFAPASPAIPLALATPALVAVTLVSSTTDAAASVVSSLSPSVSALTIAGGAGVVSALLVGLCAPPGVFSSGSASGPGAAALVARGPFAAHRAWMRRSGPTNDRVPPAPTASTDVSPD